MKHTKWHFDGHGINNDKGERICKVCSGEPYVYPEGKPVRNKRFDDLSNLIASAPELKTIVKKLIKLETDPDNYLGDLADLVQEARELMDEIEGRVKINYDNL